MQSNLKTEFLCQGSYFRFTDFILALSDSSFLVVCS